MLMASPSPRLAPAALTLCAILAPLSGLCAQEPPRILELSPAHEALDVDASELKQLVLTFDRAMQEGRSLCGGGPNFPKVVELRWKNSKTLLVDVELEPDRDYELSINCPAATNFRAADGTPLPPTPWTFSTLPEKLPPQKEQRARNKAALDQLVKLLAERYSYYDLRVKDWAKLRAQHEKQILGAQTDKVWAGAAARMLAPAQDIHMTLRAGERVFATGRRAVDSLWRLELVKRHFETRSVGDLALAGRSKDGIGYVAIHAWSFSLDVELLERVLVELADAKASVIDARTNAGGDEQIARRVAAWFVEGKRTYAKNRYRTGPGKNGFGPVLEREIHGNEDPAKRWHGPLAVLTSRYAMSSNESFVMMLQQAPDCVLVGEPTFGSSANPKAHELSNGITLVAPSWQDLRLDGTCFEGEGIAPDLLVEVRPETLATKDPILERALEHLRARLRRGD